MRLVDAEYALKLAEDPDYGFESWNGNLDDVKCLLSDCPTVEAKPIVHAHWIIYKEDKGNSYYQCSHCTYGYRTNSIFPCVKKYCSECGAQMDEPFPQAHENDNRKAGG